MVLNVPILFLIFNRLDTTKQVFEEIKKAKPKRLYIAADGPRTDVEKEKTGAVRKYVLGNIDWKCEVKTLFRKNNLGCGKAVSQAINWFFKNEEMGIILEDDCLPDQSFFPFCETLLKKYKNDKKIMCISGDNFQYGGIKVKESYFFSKYPHIWGWATWRRAWKKYDFEMKNWNNLKKAGKTDFLFDNFDEKMVFSSWFNRIERNINFTWDVQWLFTLFFNKGFSVYPNTNLVKNIGFGKDSTHTQNMPLYISEIKLNSIKKIVFPKKIVRNIQADEFNFNMVFLTKNRSIFEKVIFVIRKIIGVHVI